MITKITHENEALDLHNQKLYRSNIQFEQIINVRIFGRKTVV